MPDVRQPVWQHSKGIVQNSIQHHAAHTQHRGSTNGEPQARTIAAWHLCPIAIKSNHDSLVLLLEGSSYLVSVIAALLKWRMSLYTAGNGFAGPSQQAHCPRVTVLHSGRQSQHKATAVRRRVHGVHIGCIANFTDGSNAPHAPLKSLLCSSLHVTRADPLLTASGCGALKMATFRLTRLWRLFPL